MRCRLRILLTVGFCFLQSAQAIAQVEGRLHFAYEDCIQDPEIMPQPLRPDEAKPHLKYQRGPIVEGLANYTSSGHPPLEIDSDRIKFRIARPTDKSSWALRVEFSNTKYFGLREEIVDREDRGFDVCIKERKAKTIINHTKSYNLLIGEPSRAKIIEAFEVLLILIADNPREVFYRDAAKAIGMYSKKSGVVHSTFEQMLNDLKLSEGIPGLADLQTYTILRDVAYALSKYDQSAIIVADKDQYDITISIYDKIFDFVSARVDDESWPNLLDALGERKKITCSESGKLKDCVENLRILFETNGSPDHRDVEEYLKVAIWNLNEFSGFHKTATRKKNEEISPVELEKLQGNSTIKPAWVELICTVEKYPIIQEFVEDLDQDQAFAKFLYNDRISFAKLIRGEQGCTEITG